MSPSTRNPVSSSETSLAGIAIHYHCGESFLAGWSTSWSIEPAPADGYQLLPLLVCSLICRHCGMQHTFTFSAKEEIL